MPRASGGVGVSSAPRAVARGCAPLRHPAEWMSRCARARRARTSTRSPVRSARRPSDARRRTVRRRRREAIPVSAATTRSRTPDRLCAEAVDLARDAAEEAAAPGAVGEHLGVVAEGDRVVTHYFACTSPATGAGAGRSRSPAPPAPRSSPWTRRCCCPAPTPCSRPSGCRGASGCAPATWAPATCCPPRRRTCAWSPATPARTSRRRTRPSPRRWRELVEAEDAEVTGGRAGGAADRPGPARSPRSPRSSACGRPGCCPATACTSPPTAGRRSSAPRPPWPRRPPPPASAAASCSASAGSLRQAFGVCANEFSSGRRPRGLSRVRLRRPLRGRRHAGPAAAGRAGARFDGGGCDCAAAGIRGWAGASGIHRAGGSGPLLTGRSLRLRRAVEVPPELLLLSRLTCSGCPAARPAAPTRRLGGGARGRARTRRSRPCHRGQDGERKRRGTCAPHLPQAVRSPPATDREKSDAST